MPEDFTQYLIMILIGLLFAKDYLLPPLLKKFGLENGKNNGYQKQIDELHEHAQVANREMGEIRKDIIDIKENIAFIKGKLL